MSLVDGDFYGLAGCRVVFRSLLRNGECGRTGFEGNDLAVFHAGYRGVGHGIFEGALVIVGRYRQGLFGAVGGDDVRCRDGGVHRVIDDVGVYVRGVRRVVVAFHGDGGRPVGGALGYGGSYTVGRSCDGGERAERAHRVGVCIGVLVEAAEVAAAYLQRGEPGVVDKLDVIDIYKIIGCPFTCIFIGGEGDEDIGGRHAAVDDIEGNVQLLPAVARGGLVIEGGLGIFYAGVVCVFGVLVIGVSVNHRVYAGIVAGIPGHIFYPHRHGIGFPGERLVVTRIGGIGFVVVGCT